MVDPLVMPIGAMRTAGRQVFRLLSRLRDELGVNTTCGASNVSFGLPKREGINAAFLPMAIATGLTSAITNPLLPDVRETIMAADVLMGNDPDCRPLDPRPPGPHGGGRDRAPGQPPPAGRGLSAGPVAGSPDPLVIFTPSGRRGRFPAGTSVLDAARSLGVDIDSVCGGRGICGRCQVEQGVGAFPKHGITSLPDHLAAPDAVEREYAGRRGLADGRRLSCAAAIAGDAVIDVPAGSQVHRQVVRKELEVRALRPRSRSRGCTTWRWPRPTSPRRPSRPGPRPRRPRAGVGPEGARDRPGHDARAAGGGARGRTGR